MGQNRESHKARHPTSITSLLQGSMNLIDCSPSTTVITSTTHKNNHDHDVAKNRSLKRLKSSAKIRDCHDTKKPCLNNSNNSMDQETCEKVNEMLSQLTRDEVEMAARASSYDYFMKSSEGGAEKNDDNTRNDLAKIMICRYLESKKGNVKVALKRLQSTLQFRRTMDVEGLIRAFDNNNNSDYVVDNDDKDSYQLPLQKLLSSKKMFVQGYDKEGRATLIFIPRFVQGHDLEWSLKEALYSIERASACTKATDGTINAVVDFSGFSILSHAPPLEIGKQFMTTLRSHYAGQIHKIFLLDTPYTFEALWKVFKPFVGTKTRDKIHFVSGDNAKRTKLGDLYTLDQVPDWMIPGGQKNRALDLNEYLFETNFDVAFDETTTTPNQQDSQ